MQYKLSLNWEDARRDLKGCAGIYMIENIENGDCYIGQATCIWTRIRRHFQQMRDQKHKNQHLQRAVSKYGLELFVVNIMQFCTNDSQENLDACENFFIALHAQHGKPYPAYNNRPDARSARGMPSPMRGKQYSQEVRDRMREAQRNRAPWSFSEEELEKRRKRMRESAPLKNPEVAARAVAKRRADGSYNRPEQILRLRGLSDAKKVAIERIDPKTGEVVEYASAADAMKIDGFDKSSIGRAIHGKIKTCGGFFWRYAPLDAPQVSINTPA